MGTTPAESHMGVRASHHVESLGSLEYGLVTVG